MAMHLRCDSYFVEDEAWHEAATDMRIFWNRTVKKKGCTSGTWGWVQYSNHYTFSI